MNLNLYDRIFLEATPTGINIQLVGVTLYNSITTGIGPNGKLNSIQAIDDIKHIFGDMTADSEEALLKRYRDITDYLICHYDSSNMLKIKENTESL